MALFYSLVLALYFYVANVHETEGRFELLVDRKLKVVCYYTSWSHGRKAPYGLTPDKIDPFLCTHIVYAFGDIGDSNNIVSADPEFDFDEGAYQSLVGLKKQNPDLKVMLSLGGWAAGTKGFAKISANESDRVEFAKNAVKYLREYGFDGLDLNWQHPTFREGGKEEDRENYVLLSKALREEIDDETLVVGPRLLLSVAITHNQKFLPAYDLASLDKYMDFISVICYDYHFSHETTVNHHSPLLAFSDSKEDSKINSNYTISFFKKYIQYLDKLILGIPTYGRTYKLKDPSKHALGSQADGAADKGPYTGEKGFLSFYEICSLVKNDNWTVVQQKPGAVGPYAFKGDQWVGYDDVESTKTKAEYAKKERLGGIMFWTLDFDDFTGSCLGVKNPVISAARDVLNKE